MKSRVSDLGFWGKLKKPIFILAPMANVTDAAFRGMFAKYGKPDVFWTEFVSVEALCGKGKANALLDLTYSKKEHPIVAQVFGSNPKTFRKAARLIEKLGFDGIDINMGCPDRNIEKSGGGAALMKNPSLAKEIIEETAKGTILPVSVKTRIGYGKDITEEWVGELLKARPAAIILHARTRREMSNVPANWDAVQKAVEVRNKAKSKTLIIGNGDVEFIEDARKKAKETGCDGIMFGRGVFGNPWFFKGKKLQDMDIQTRLKAMCEHAALFEKLFKERKNFAVMKKHFKAYTSGFKGAKELRTELMKTENAKGVKKAIRVWKTSIIDRTFKTDV